VHNDLRWGHEKTSFWDSSWLQGRRPKDIAPLLFQISRKKKHSVHEALTSNTWIHDIDINNGINSEHLASFVLLWNMIQHVQLHPDQEDTITWKLTAQGYTRQRQLTKRNF
jgi:hypothetical protein